jgi:transcriptional regulator of nitric oxide reductase
MGQAAREDTDGTFLVAAHDSAGACRAVAAKDTDAAAVASRVDWDTVVGAAAVRRLVEDIAAEDIVAAFRDVARVAGAEDAAPPHADVVGAGTAVATTTAC